MGLASLRIAQAVSNNLPLVELLGRDPMIVGELAKQNNIASLTNAVKARNEVTLEYKLIAPGKATPALAKTENVKAQSDGENVCALLIEQLTVAISRVL